MNRSTRAFAATALLAMACVCIMAPASLAQDRQVRTVTGSVPAAVLGAFNDAYPDAEIEEMASLSEGGRPHYEIAGVDGGMAVKAVYLADGTLVAVEEDMIPELLPESVTKAIEERHPGSKIVKAVRNTRDDVTTYMLKVVAGGRRLTMVLDQDGAVLRARDTGGKRR